MAVYQAAWQALRRHTVRTDYTRLVDTCQAVAVEAFRAVAARLAVAQTAVDRKSSCSAVGTD
jgi:hypothetical protein